MPALLLFFIDEVFGLCYVRVPTIQGVRRVGSVRHHDSEDEHSPGEGAEPPAVAEVNIELKDTALN